ncbi:MAG: 2-C-methyl-D-erythritol 4-phosphate cytidylyltransferase, partial [Rickettsiales bacterium]|nr:2-C-methyl-D-erythritol 4-phosphate cytidylyltransferase [Rickettsiales bacterium]
MPTSPSPRPPEKTIALLVAAGKSERMQADLPKPYLSVGHESVLKHTIKVFLEHPLIDGVRVVIRREHHALYKQSIQGLTLFPCVMGGATRQASVRRGLESLIHRRPERVLVHDAARPLVHHSLITRVVEALDAHEAVVPALSVHDTLRRVKDGHSETVAREDLFAMQTPQGFHYGALLAAHRRFAGEQLTDDAAVMERAGAHIHMVAGDAGNIKLTTASDMDMIQHALYSQLETRVGTGYDVHA